MSGTNAHVILEQAPHDPASTPTDPQRSPDDGQHTASAVGVVPWVVSARSAEALRGQASRLREFLDEHPQLGETAVGWSLATTRSVFEHRAVILGTDRTSLLEGLATVETATTSGGVIVGGTPVPAGGRRVAVVFSGQGAQRVGMGRRLYEQFPLFAAVFDEVCGLFEGRLPRGLREVFFTEGPAAQQQADQTVYAQAGLFAFEASLWELLRSWGVRVDAVAGHSIGEVAAAYAAGVLTLPDAVELVAARGTLMQALPAGGAMLAVAISEPHARQLLADLGPHGQQTTIAAVNGPAAVVLSGPRPTIDELHQRCAQAGHRTRQLRVSHAFHSPLMEPMLDDFTQTVHTLRFANPTITAVSTVTGTLLTGQWSHPQYWVDQVREPVRYHDAVHTLHNLGITAFLEAGPGTTLTAMTLETLTTTNDTDDSKASPEKPAVAIPLLRGEPDEPHAFLTGLAEAFVAGVDIDWTQTFTPTTERVALPTYAFQRRRYWLETQEPAYTQNVPEPTDDRLWRLLDTDGAAGLAAELELAEDAPLNDVASALSAWHVRRQEQSRLDNWRYQETWKPVPHPPLPGRELSGTWLVVRHSPTARTETPPAELSHTETAQWLSTGLAKAGAHPLIVDVTESDLDRPVLAQQLRETTDRAGQITGVVSLLADRETTLPEHDTLTTGLVATLLLLQALGDADIQAPLWCLTRGAVTTTPGEPLASTAQAQIWGLGRVAALEHPDRWGGLIDLPDNPHLPDPPKNPTLAQLCHILTGTTGEDQLALRPTGLLARRLEHAPPTPTPPAPHWDPQGTILITGGTGGLGSQVARWLAHHGARNLLLTSRRGPDTPGAEKLRTELNTLGAQTTITACDITNHQATTNLLTTIPPEHPLTAVFHLAGISQAKKLEHTTVADLADVVKAKAQGAKVLDELLGDRKLGSFTLFSSASATWGAGMLAGDAAGNAFLDALAQQRRDRGLVGTSVAWGPWADEGMAAGDTQHEWRRVGLPPMAPQLALRALGQAINSDQSVTVADVHWPQFAAGFTAARPSPLIADLPEVVALTHTTNTAPSQTSPTESAALRQRITSMTPAEQHTTILEIVQREIAAELDYPTPDTIHPQRAFHDFGVDSLTAVKIRNRITTQTSLTLPTSLLFDYPTPQLLAAHLRERLREGEARDSSVLQELDKLEELLAAAASSSTTRAMITMRLSNFLSELKGLQRVVPDASPEVDEEIGAATNDEIFELIKNEFGISRPDLCE